MTDRWMGDGCMHEKKMLLSHNPTMRGSDVASLVELHLGGDIVTNKWTDGGCTDGRTEK